MLRAVSRLYLLQGGTEERRMKRTIIGMAAMTAVAVLLATVPVGTAQAADSSLEELIPQLATTPEQHKAVARYYRGEAASASAEAARHREMGRTYSQGNYTRKKAMQEHCERLATTYDSLAKQYEEIAAEHEQSAAK
jgi:hypothetical protein